MKKTSGVFLLILLLPLYALHGQTTPTTKPTDPSMVSTQFDTSGFPQWAKDLRRGEIVAFGSFPFAYLFTNFGMDGYRWAAHGRDSTYAPWPFNGAGTVGKNQHEKFMTLCFAAGGSVLIALIDFGIERYKRSVKEREIRNLPEGTPIIVRKPLQSPEADTGAENP